MRYLIVYFCAFYSLTAQTVRINEVVSSNSEYFDENGDTPDWIELYNYGTQEVSLEGWSLSDNQDNLSKWNFPAMTLTPNQYLLLWASSKDRSFITHARTLINEGDNFKYILPSSEPNSSWKSLNFNDANWSNGNSGFGYADGDDTTVIPNGTQSIYLRKKFSITDIDNIASLILDIDYDDAFVAYINGVEVARANINGNPPAYNAGTTVDREAMIYQGGYPERYEISDFRSILNEGENILNIQAHNISANSSDFTLIPFLSAIFTNSSNLGITPPQILRLSSDENNLHTNFKIASDSETLSLSNADETIVDQILVENLPANTSLGRSRSTNQLVIFSETTPAAQNATNSYLGAVQSTVVFSEEKGLLDGPISLQLSGNNNGEIIRYETGGKEPTGTSAAYTNPISINRNTVVRAKIFLNNHLPSKVFTKSYILNADHDIDVAMISADPAHFFNQNTGIYVFGPAGTYESWIPYFGANFWEDWERPVHFSFYEKDSDAFAEFNAGVKIFGGWSRGQNGQKSMALFARGKYGDSKFKHPFFDALSYENFESMVLRNSGQDWMRSSMKDITLTSLMRGSGLDFQEHNPVATYINGSYWGMYNLREKINEHMLASKHNIDADEITLLTNNAEEIEGSNDEYRALINYISSTNLSIDTNFEYVAEQIDLEEYALYQAANIFIGNTDWPGNNIKFWKHPEGKWRWIMYDTDFGFGPFWNTENYEQDTLEFALDPNGPGWPNPSWSTLLFRKLITNIGFRNRFINRYADELNTRFLSENVNAHIDQIYQSIAPEINAHYNRWKTDPSLTQSNVNIENTDGWVNYYVNVMRNFANNRPSIAKEHLQSKFNLPGIHGLTISNPTQSQGFVEINDNLKIQTSNWSGDYFETVPVALKAVAAPGYSFSHWSGDVSSTEESIAISLNQPVEAVANFVASDTPELLVINEIHYTSSNNFNPGDWIELYNPNATTIDLSNWKLSDDDDTHVYTFPENTTIAAESYLVLAKNTSSFSNNFPNITNIIGDFDFGFGNSDSARIFDENDILQDEVIYLSDAPWPNCTGSYGSTIRLNTWDSDNSLAENWSCQNGKGSPGMLNTNEPSSKTAIKIYPNPVEDTLYILGTENSTLISVYSILGKLVLQQTVSKTLEIGKLRKGIYLVEINENGSSTIHKIVKN
jgi:hypothetical protein